MNNFFAFRLRRDKNNYYRVISEDVTVVPPPTDPTLPQRNYELKGPGGWREEGIKWNRNETYRGILRSFSDSLMFVEDGAEILRYVLINEGTEGLLQLEVLIRNNDTWLYDPYFIGDVDLSTATVGYSGGNNGIVCKLKEGGATAALLSNDSIPYELPLAASYGEYALFYGLTLLGSQSYVQYETDGYDGPGTYVPLASAVKEGEYNIGLSQTADVFGPDQADFYKHNIFEAYISMSCEFITDLYLDSRTESGLSFAGRLYYEIQVYNKAGVFLNGSSSVRFVDPSPIAPGTTENRHITDTYSYPLLEGDYVIAIMYVKNVSSGVLYNTKNIHFLDTGKLYIKQRFKLPETIAPFYRYYDAFHEVWAKACDSQYAFKSDFLKSKTPYVDSRPGNCVITCGKAIRQLGTVDKPIRMALTLRDLNADSSHRYCLGAGIENSSSGSEQLRVEPLSYFYQDVEIADLGDVSNFGWAYDASNLFNQLTVGMQSQTYDNLNGLDEFNASQTLKLPFGRSPSELDWRSPFRYDMYGIEKERQDLQDKTTTDNNADKDIFLADISDTYVLRNKKVTITGVETTISIKAFQLNRPNTTFNTSGLIDPAGAYNISLSPGHDRKRMLPEIASRIYPRKIGALTYQTSDKNPDLVSNLGWGTIIEKADEPLPLSNPLMYKPYIFRFTAAVPADLHLKMSYNPYGYISFSVFGIKFKGHINKAGQADAENLTFDFELIAHKDTDEGALPRYV